MNTDLDSHPFVRAWESRDIATWIDALADDVTLHSPLLSTPFHGRDVAHRLYTVLLDSFDGLEVTHHCRDGDTECFEWRSSVRGRAVQGIDVIHYRGDGLVDDVTVYMRPLTAIGAFAATTGPPFARHRGRAAEILTWMLTRPLRPLFAVVDRVAPLLLPLGRARASIASEPGVRTAPRPRDDHNALT